MSIDSTVLDFTHNAANIAASIFLSISAYLFVALDKCRKELYRCNSEYTALTISLSGVEKMSPEQAKEVVVRSMARYTPKQFGEK